MSLSQSLPSTIAFHEGKYRPLAECQINIATHALQYATMVFGGIRVYYNSKSDRKLIFRLPDHIDRMFQSARMLFMESPHTKMEMQKIIIELVQKNDYAGNLYIRPFIYKHERQLSPRLHNLSDAFSVYVTPLEDYLNTETGLSVGVTSWRRVDDNSIPARAKCSGSYLNSSLAKSESMLQGYDEAIFLDSQGFVCEGSAENIFIIRNEELITPPISGSVLEGITRRSILSIAKELGIACMERTISRTELYICDEVFLCGTGAQIAWIKEIDHRKIGDGKMGPIAKQLKDHFLAIVYGNDPKFSNWLTTC